MEQEKEEFRRIILRILENLPKISNEKDVRKAYREQEGHNINIMIDKLDAGNLYNFLRFQCRDICEVYKNDGDIKVQKLDVVPQPEEPKSHKKKHKNAAPKLNYPTINHVYKGKRPNPQGFNKKMYVEPNGEATPSKPPSGSVCVPAANVYRPADQLGEFYQRGDSDEDDDFPLAANYFKGSSVSLVEEEPSNTLSDFIQFPKSQPEPPRVQNPFEFPTLPVKNKKKKKQQQQQPEVDLHESYQEYQDYEEGGTSESSNSFEVARRHPPEHYERISIFDPILHQIYPDIVTDPGLTVPTPNIKILYQKITFDVHITTVLSPDNFWFQYGDETLNSLMNQMQDFYEDIDDCDLRIPAEDFKLDLIVAAKPNEFWLRARVLSLPDEKDEVLLFFVDFGTTEPIHISKIRFMIHRFMQDPVKALRGSLLGLKPKHVEWDPIENQVFYDSVANKKLFATIKAYDSNSDAFKIELFEKVCAWPGIAEQMARRGFGAFTVEEVVDNFRYAIPLAC